MSKYFDDGVCRYLFTQYDENDESRGFYTVEKCPRQTTEISVPDEINGSPVTAVADLAFNCKSIIKNITLSKELTDIGDLAFNGCSSIERIVIPSKVRRIGKNAFAGCSSMRTVVIPPSVESIGDDAFENSDALEKIYVTEDSFAHRWIAKQFYDADISGTGKLNVLFEKIAFYSPQKDGQTSFFSPIYDFDCEFTDDGAKLSLYNGGESVVRIPPKIGDAPVIAIGADTFRGCTKVRAVYIPASVRKISTNAFDMCPSLDKITVDPANTHFSSNGGVLFNKSGSAAVRCPEGFREGTLTLPAGVTEIADNAFLACKNLRLVNMPATLVSIGKRSFSECHLLQSFTMPPSLENIGDGAFADCTALTDITVSPMLAKVGTDLFKNCTNIKSVFTIPGAKSVRLISRFSEAAGHIKSAPPTYYAQCMPIIMKKFEETGADIGEVTKMLSDLLGQNGIDSSSLSGLSGIPGLSELLGRSKTDKDDATADDSKNGKSAETPSDSDDTDDADADDVDNVDDVYNIDDLDEFEGLDDISDDIELPDIDTLIKRHFSDDAENDDDADSDENKHDGKHGKKPPRGNTASVTFITNGDSVADLLRKLSVDGEGITMDGVPDGALELFDSLFADITGSERRKHKQSSKATKSKKKEIVDPIKAVTDEQFDEFLAKYDALFEKTDPKLLLVETKKEED